MRLLDKPPCSPFCEGLAPIVAIELNTGRTLKVRLNPLAAPITVAYFLTLVREGFYDGLRFHRVVPGFLLQGGDPRGTGDGETEFYVKGEFEENGVHNPMRHVAGTVSLARQDGCDTASCQFFILANDVPSMDGHYAAFGIVTEGFDAVQSLSLVDVDANSAPLSPIVMERVYLLKGPQAG